jgi:hypothetical protein
MFHGRSVGRSVSQSVTFQFLSRKNASVVGRPLWRQDGSAILVIHINKSARIHHIWSVLFQGSTYCQNIYKLHLHIINRGSLECANSCCVRMLVLCYIVIYNNCFFCSTFRSYEIITGRSRM